MQPDPCAGDCRVAALHDGCEAGRQACQLPHLRGGATWPPKPYRHRQALPAKGGAAIRVADVYARHTLLLSLCKFIRTCPPQSISPQRRTHITAQRQPGPETAGSAHVCFSSQSCCASNNAPDPSCYVLTQGAWGNTQRRHWQKFTAWSPASQTSVRGAVPDSA